MRRRTKRGPNESEATGKIGQEIPQGQPTPLQPAYPDERGTSEENAAPERPKGRGAAGKLIDKLMHKPSGKHEATTENPPVEAHPQPLTQAFQEGSHPGEASAGAAAQAEGNVESHAAPAALAAIRPEAETPEAAKPEAAKPETPQEGNLVLETQPESPSQPPPELPLTSAKNPRGYVVLAIGLPGSGKTTWFKRRGVMPLSSDMLRSILFDDISEQRYQGLVFSTLRSLLRARLIAKMPWNYVDATNLSPHERRQWIKMAKSFGYDVQAVFFDVPYEICIERNHRRERIVSDETMKKMAERLRPPSFKEGFSKITMVRVKGAPPVKREESAEQEVR